LVALVYTDDIENDDIEYLEQVEALDQRIFPV